MSTPSPSPPNLSLSLIPITHTSEIPPLVSLHTSAFASDAFSNLMLRGREEGAHQRLMTESIESWLRDDGAQVVKAVDARREVVGWACWVLDRGGGEDEAREAVMGDQKVETKVEALAGPENETARAHGSNNNHLQDAKHITTSPDNPPEAPSSSNPLPSNPARALAQKMHAHHLHHKTLHLHHKSHIILQALATDPHHQRQGIGSQLVQWVVDRANERGLPCWAHASPASWRVYERAGFGKVGRWEMEIGEGERYCFRYMLREGKGKGMV
ncbi:MAG: hypothetical protein Q9160_002897 [Pyrenula sp. 1 TL-2023]